MFAYNFAITIITESSSSSDFVSHFRAVDAASFRKISNLSTAVGLPEVSTQSIKAHLIIISRPLKPLPYAPPLAPIIKFPFI